MQTTEQSHLATEVQQGQEQLISESYVPQTMPHLLGTMDMTSLFLLNVFWVTNVTPISANGPAGFTYWIIGGLFFFIPCSLVLAQLAAVFPYAGSIYNWTSRALGPGWAFFVGICAWLPGVLSIVNAAAAAVSCLQALNSTWLALPWQQGIVIVVMVVFSGVLASQRTRMVQNILNFGVAAMGLATALIGAAALGWLAGGHHPQTNLTDASSYGIVALGPSANIALLGSAVLALMGSDMPLAMAGEMRSQRVIARHLTLGTICTLVGYLVFTFAILVVQGANTAANTVNPMLLLLATIDQVFGKALGGVMAICLLLYFLLIPVALNVCFSRLLLAAAIDRRLSIWFARLNLHRVPINAIVAQTAIAGAFTAILYFLIPQITFFGDPAKLTSEAYNVIGASLLLVWSVSFLFPFIDLAVLYLKNRAPFLQRRVVPLPLLAYSVIAGIVLCTVTIYTTLFNSFIPSLLPSSQWSYIVGTLTFVALVICAILSMITNSQAGWEDINV